jgi:hypothetical protein
MINSFFFNIFQISYSYKYAFRLYYRLNTPIAYKNATSQTIKATINHGKFFFLLVKKLAIAKDMVVSIRGIKRITSIILPNLL